MSLSRRYVITVQEMLPILLIFGVMYLVLIVPQQRTKRKHAALLASLVEGDEVVLNSGIHGFVGALEENVLWLEVSGGVELKVSRSSVAAKVTDSADDDSVDEDSADEDSSDGDAESPIDDAVEDLDE